MFRTLVLFALLFALASCQAAYRLTKTDLADMRLDQTEFLLKRDDNPPYRLADIYENHRGLVLIFWQSRCPCVKRYQNRIEQLFKRYGEKGLAFMYVLSNLDETFLEAKETYEKRGGTLPLVRDEGGRLKKALRVRSTPTAVLLDKQGQVKFMGWIDNEHNENEGGRIAYLENAIEEYLDDKPVSTPTSPMFGCAIR